MTYAWIPQVFFWGSGWEIPRFHVEENGIEANMHKFQVFITIRSPNNVKEVHQLTRHFVALKKK